jgi:hypothetical protein
MPITILVSMIYEISCFILTLIERTTNGSHRIFYKEGIEEIINIQPNGSKAKPYQVKQVRLIILKYKLMSDGK